jgi:hypothetical protein
MGIISENLGRAISGNGLDLTGFVWRGPGPRRADGRSGVEDLDVDHERGRPPVRDGHPRGHADPPGPTPPPAPAGGPGY